jgi:hypothetical protein
MSATAVDLQNNNLLLFGGLNEFGGDLLSELFVYSSISQTWTWQTGAQALNVAPVYPPKGSSVAGSLTALGSRASSTM